MLFDSSVVEADLISWCWEVDLMGGFAIESLFCFGSSISASTKVGELFDCWLLLIIISGILVVLDSFSLAIFSEKVTFRLPSHLTRNVLI